jgi:hypothetical protein
MNPSLDICEDNIMDEVEETPKKTSTQKEVAVKLIGLAVAVMIGMVGTAVTEKVNDRIRKQIVKDE